MSSNVGAGEHCGAFSNLHIERHQLCGGTRGPFQGHNSFGPYISITHLSVLVELFDDLIECQDFS